MKKVLGLLVMVLLSACGEDFKHKSEFDKSFQKWNSFKAASNNSYRYIVTGSSWTGVSWETELVVERGEVTGRFFRYTRFGKVQRPATGWDDNSAEAALQVLRINREEFRERHGIDFLAYSQWEERGVELNTHTGTSAADVTTLDAVYQKARTEWLQKRVGVTTYFETKNAGLISSVGYVEDNCADDCFLGISIRLIEKM